MNPFTALALDFLSPGVVWLVDGDGYTVILGVEAFAALSAADLQAYHAFFRAETAERFRRCVQAACGVNSLNAQDAKGC